MTYIKFHKIEKYFGANHILKGIDMEIKKGDFVTLLGPSGCGKSTFLRCLAGLETVDQGKIYLEGEDITKKEAKDRNIGMVFQQYSLFPNLTVEENIEFGLKLKKVDISIRKKKVLEAIEMVELKGKEKQYPLQLSGGQQQRVALARSIVMEPKVLLLDEPFSAIDAKLRKALQRNIKRITKELNLTTVFVTHDQDEAMLMSDVIHLFHDGKIEQSGAPIQIYTKPNTSFAAEFIGNYNILVGDELEKVIGEQGSVRKIGIRPETIHISKEREENKDEYCFEGIVESHIPRGNVLRYSIRVNGVKLHVDVLFRSFVLFENGERVYLSVSKKNCIPIQES